MPSSLLRTYFTRSMKPVPAHTSLKSIRALCLRRFICDRCSPSCWPDQVRFGPKATYIQHCRKMSRLAERETLGGHADSRRRQSPDPAGDGPRFLSSRVSAGGKLLHCFRRQRLAANSPLAAGYLRNLYPGHTTHVLAFDRDHGVGQLLDDLAFLLRAKHLLYEMDLYERHRHSPMLASPSEDERQHACRSGAKLSECSDFIVRCTLDILHFLLPRAVASQSLSGRFPIAKMLRSPGPKRVLADQ
jgi:hypothetical protein